MTSYRALLLPVADPFGGRFQGGGTARAHRVKTVNTMTTLRAVLVMRGVVSLGGSSLEIASSLRSSQGQNRDCRGASPLAMTEGRDRRGASEGPSVMMGVDVSRRGRIGREAELAGDSVRVITV